MISGYLEISLKLCHKLNEREICARNDTGLNSPYFLKVWGGSAADYTSHSITPRPDNITYKIIKQFSRKVEQRHVAEMFGSCPSKHVAQMFGICSSKLDGEMLPSRFRT